MAKNLFRVGGALLLQLIPAFSLGFLLAHLGRSGGNGWGDLIGAVVGFFLGSWIGFVASLGWLYGIKGWVLLLSAALWWPFTLLIVSIGANAGLSLIIIWAGVWFYFTLMCVLISSRLAR